MEPEIELELFAALCADVEAGRPLADVLRAEGLLETTWAQSRDTWMGRMSNAPDAERKTLEERYLASFHARKRMSEWHAAPAAPGENEDPPTRRAPMGTIILGLKQTVRPDRARSEDTQSNDSAPTSATPPMGTIAPETTNKRSTRTASSPELTPPMGVPAPNLTDIPAPKKSLPNPELTPPMGVSVPNLSDRTSTKSLPKSEVTPPMGVPAPNLADIPAPKPLPKPLPKPEVTPPMGVPAPNLADIPAPKPLPKAPPNPEITPPMGVPAPNLADSPPARSRRAPEPTPPMRHRSDLIPDDMARAAENAVADRKTDPPPPVPSRPALPFPAPTHAGASGPVSVPSAPNSTGYRSAAGYPAAPAQGPAPIAPPMQFPQASAAASSSPTYGSYPSMMSLAAQGVAAPAPAASSPGFTPPAKPPGPPFAMGGFPATSSGPRLTLEVYAAFAAEIALKPVDVAEIRERYGLSDVIHTAEDEAWQRRFSSDRDTYVRYAKLFQHYRDWFSGRTPR